MPLDWYAQKYNEGSITNESLQAAVNRAPKSVVETFADGDQSLSVSSLVNGLHEVEKASESVYRPGAFSAFMDAREGSHWSHIIREEAAKWCGAYYDRGQASWPMPGRISGFYQAWLEAVKYDHSLACMGLKQAHITLSEMPETPEDAIHQAIQTMNVPEQLTSEWLYRVLMNLPGWAGYLRYRDREKELRGGSGTELVQLLAILVNYECTLYKTYSEDKDRLLGWKRLLMEEPIEMANLPMSLELAHRLIWQSAFEHSIEQSLKESIHSEDSMVNDSSPEIQAAFCIDVRSELYRRNLEAALPEIQTIGFAGFFGVPLSHTSFGLNSEEARCPALLAPPVHSCDHSHHKHTDPHGPARNWRMFRESAASSFNFVETLGLSYAWNLLKNAFGLGNSSHIQRGMPELIDVLTIEEKVKLAVGIVNGLSLTKHCGKLVLLCGHGSATKNNPYASGLDCGACGGHPGEANARIAAMILNEPDVRSALIEHGVSVPLTTYFIAGQHNTTTDEVIIFDECQAPASHQQLLKTLKQALAKASILTATHRAKSLNIEEEGCVEAVKARSTDWSQVRPEWGLAGNAGFIVAPRAWTKSSNLKGRAFLHEYDPTVDPEGHVLEGILAGPLVVGSWINLQYYASSVDNQHFGSGHKAIHNVVGGVGVALGNENDLQTGLPLQSVHDGKQWVHEPSRLHALIAADPDVIEQILNRQSDLKNLLDNEWLHIFALGADGQGFSRRLPSGQWQTDSVTGMDSQLAAIHA